METTLTQALEESRTAVLTAVLLHEEYPLNLHSVRSAFCVNRLPVLQFCSVGYNPRSS